MARSALDVVELIRQRLADADMAGFTDLFAADAVFEYPFGFPGAPDVLRGRERIKAHLVESRRDIRKLIEIDGITSTVHQSVDPEVVIVETEITGTTLATGEPFRFVSGVGVVTVRNGEVVAYRDYMNMLGAARITGGQGPIAISRP
ncbi:MAG TPA: nuclear transport factor 2 family protein [Pseudonocardiaceae bacterium]|nr:nuclear transport factor 2 family protein [Pseudonocardiaceae bacterium]